MSIPVIALSSAALAVGISAWALMRQSRPPPPIAQLVLTGSLCETPSVHSITPRLEPNLVAAKLGDLEFFHAKGIDCYVFDTACVKSANFLLTEMVQKMGETEVIGFDVEMAQRKGHTPYPDVLSFSFRDIVVIYRPRKSNALPGAARDILMSPRWIKVGASIQNDVLLVARTFQVPIDNAVDLSTLALTVAFKETPRKSTNVSLAVLAALFTPYRKDSFNDHTLWDSDPLPMRHKFYCAVDAFLGAQIYAALVKKITIYQDNAPFDPDKWSMKANVVCKQDKTPAIKLVGKDGAPWKQWSGPREADVLEMWIEIKEKSKRISLLETEIDVLKGGKKVGK